MNQKFRSIPEGALVRVIVKVPDFIDIEDWTETTHCYEESVVTGRCTWMDDKHLCVETAIGSLCIPEEDFEDADLSLNPIPVLTNNPVPRVSLSLISD